MFPSLMWVREWSPYFKPQVRLVGLAMHQSIFNEFDTSEIWSEKDVLRAGR